MLLNSRAGWLLAGLFLAIAQVHPWLWWASLVGGALFIITAKRSRNYQDAIWGGALAGLFKSMGGYIWIWQAYPLVWLGIDNSVIQFVLIAIYWVTTSAFMGLGMILPALIAYRFRSCLYWMLGLLPLAWVVGEVLGSFFDSIWLLGTGSYLNIYIGHGYVGLPLVQFPVVYPVVALSGLYGLSYLVALIGVWLAWWPIRKRDVIAGLFGLGIVVISLFFILPSPASVPDKLSIVAIDTSFSFVSQTKPGGHLIKDREVVLAIERALITDEFPDVILLPEDSRFTSRFENPEAALDYLLKLAPEANTVVVDSARVDIGEGQVTLRAFYYDLGREHIYMKDKRFFVPQGEYTTYIFRSLFNLLGQNELLELIDQNQNYVPGPLLDAKFPADIPAILFCSESSSILGVFDAKSSSESSIVLHPISRARFREPGPLSYQLDSMLRMQAIWSRVTIVTAANMAESRIYYPDGSMGTGEETASTNFWRLVSHDLY